jgi:hypothetical protein
MFFDRRHVEDRLTAFLDRELSVPAAEKVARHLDSCRQCLEAARSLKRVRVIARFVPEHPSPPGLSRRLESRMFSEPRHARPARRQVYSLAIGAVSLAVILVTAVHTGRKSFRAFPGIAAAPDKITAFDRTALRLHRERLEGSLSFEICDSSGKAVSDWLCREAGLDAPRPPITHGKNSVSAGECAAIVPEAGRRIAVVALEVGRRPVTLLTARILGIAPEETRREGFVHTQRDAATGLEVESWVSGGQAYAAVSGGND